MLMPGYLPYAYTYLAVRTSHIPTWLSPLCFYLAVPTMIVPGCAHYGCTWLFALCYIHVWMDQEPTMHIKDSSSLNLIGAVRLVTHSLR